LREERKRTVEEHVRKVNELLQEAREAGKLSDEDLDDEDEWEGFGDANSALEPVDHEEEYIDEDRYTTVAIETVVVDRDGLHRPDEDEDVDDEDPDGGKRAKRDHDAEGALKKSKFPPKKKKKKFRYESKAERQRTERKNKAGKRH